MPYYVRLESATGGLVNAPVNALHGVHFGLRTLTPLNISSVINNSTNTAGATSEIKDFAFDIEQTLSIGSQNSGAGAGKATFNPFSIAKTTDVASPIFFRSFRPGTTFPLLRLNFYMDEWPEERPAFTIDLTNAVLKGNQTIPKSPVRQKSPGSSELTRISFSFQKIQFTWKFGKSSFKDDWTK